jgi:hypothetical protein
MQLEHHRGIVTVGIFRGHVTFLAFCFIVAFKILLLIYVPDILAVQKGRSTAL